MSNRTRADGLRAAEGHHAYTVFNVAQIEGLPAQYHAQPEAKGIANITTLRRRGAPSVGFVTVT